MRCDLSEVWHNISNSTFQSTHLHEVWLKTLKWLTARTEFQSTHLHEVWLHSCTLSLSVSKFQSTHLHEVWQWALAMNAMDKVFQSTHLHEVWHLREWIYGGVDSFNPHTYMRCDFHDRDLSLDPDKFQSTHLHEVWRYYCSRSTSSS